MTSSSESLGTKSHGGASRKRKMNPTTSGVASWRDRTSSTTTTTTASIAPGHHNDNVATGSSSTTSTTAETTSSIRTPRRRRNEEYMESASLSSGGHHQESSGGGAGQQQLLKVFGERKSNASDVGGDDEDMTRHNANQETTPMANSSYHHQQQQHANNHDDNKQKLRREFKLIKNLFSRTITNDLIDSEEMKRALKMTDKEMEEASSLPNMQSNAVNWNNGLKLDESYVSEKLQTHSKIDNFILHEIGRYRKYFSDGLKRKFDTWRVAALEKDRLIIAILKREESRVNSLTQSIAHCKLMEYNHRHLVNDLFEMAERRNLSVTELRQLYNKCMSIMESGEIYKKIYGSDKIKLQKKLSAQKQAEGKFGRTNANGGGNNTSNSHNDTASASPTNSHDMITPDKSSLEDDFSTSDSTSSDLIGSQRRPRRNYDFSSSKYREKREDIINDIESMSPLQDSTALLKYAKKLKMLTEGYIEDFEFTQKMSFSHFQLLLEESNEKVFQMLTVNDQDKEVQCNFDPVPSANPSNEETEALELLKKEFTNHDEELMDIQKLLSNDTRTEPLGAGVETPRGAPSVDHSAHEDELDVERELNRLMDLHERRETESHLDTPSKNNSLSPVKSARHHEKRRRSVPFLSRSASIQSGISELTEVTDWDPRELDLETEFQQREKRQEQVERLQFERQRILNDELRATNDKLVNELEEYRTFAERSESARRELVERIEMLKNKKPVEPQQVKRLSQKLVSISDEHSLLSDSHKKKTELLQQQIEQMQKEKEELVRQMKVREYRKRIYDSLTKLGSSRHLQVDPQLNFPKGVIGMIFSDIVESTTMWSSIPKAMEKCIYLHHETIRNIIAQFHGRVMEVKTEGDAFFVVTSDCSSGVQFMIKVQMALLNAPWPEELLRHPYGRELRDDNGTVIFRGLRVRMGMHYARAIMAIDRTTGRPDWYGREVAQAARAETVAEPGCCAITPTVWEEIRDSIDRFPIPIAVKHVGKIAFKGIPQPQLMRLIAPKQLGARVKQSNKKDTDLLIENKLFDLVAERNRLVKKMTDLQTMLRRKMDQLQVLKEKNEADSKEKDQILQQKKELEERNKDLQQDYLQIEKKLEALEKQHKQFLRQQEISMHSKLAMEEDPSTRSRSPKSPNASKSRTAAQEEALLSGVKEQTSLLLTQADAALKEIRRAKTGWRMTLSKSTDAKKVHHLIPMGKATRIAPNVSQNDLETLLKKSMKHIEALQKQLITSQKERESLKYKWNNLHHRLKKEAQVTSIDPQNSVNTNLSGHSRRHGGLESAMGTAKLLPRQHSYDSFMTANLSLSSLDESPGAQSLESTIIEQLSPMNPPTSSDSGSNRGDSDSLLRSNSRNSGKKPGHPRKHSYQTPTRSRSPSISPKASSAKKHLSILDHLRVSLHGSPKALSPLGSSNSRSQRSKMARSYDFARLDKLPKLRQ